MTTNMDLDDDIDVPLTEAQQNEVVFEMDLYAGGSTALGKPTAAGYVLQFPLRDASRPYEDPLHVKLKPTVKRMQWDIPLATTIPQYNEAADASLQVRNFALQSSRVEPGMQGLAVGIRRGDAIVLVPVSEVLQMRHSPAYLDARDARDAKAKKEKEAEAAAAAASGSGSGASGSRGASGSGSAAVHEDAEELMPITVQVKKHETEQQAEARMRSYAHHAAREESDPWVPLKFTPAEEQQSINILEKIPLVAKRGLPVTVTHTHESYLAAIVPRTNAIVLETARKGDQGEESLSLVARELGKPVGHHHQQQQLLLQQQQQQQQGVGSTGGAAAAAAAAQLSPEVLALLPNHLSFFFNAAAVLSLDTIRALLENLPANNVLHKAGLTASDAALHAAIMGTGQYLCIRKIYTLRVTNNPTYDPLRSVVLELLQEKESLKKGDVLGAARGRGIDVSDAMYSRVMKELCVSKGSTWTMKN